MTAQSAFNAQQISYKQMLYSRPSEPETYLEQCFHDSDVATLNRKQPSLPISTAKALRESLQSHWADLAIGQAISSAQSDLFGKSL